MGLLDTFTGGKSGQASDDFKRAEAYFTQLRTPTQQELTLPELKKYVEAGLMTPAEAQAYLQTHNAYDDENVDQTGTAAQVAALNQLQEIANAGERGTPMQQAQMENSLSQMNTSIGGQRGAIEQAMAARGTPTALIQAALANQVVGQEGQQAHLDAVNAQAAAYQNALNALNQQGALGGQLQGQQNQQANTVAQAANAMQQFNAANQQQNSQFNAANRQNVDTMNMANKQQVSNNNVGLENARTQYNANLPQQVFENNYRKASGAAGAAQGSGQLNQQQGQQNAGITSGLINLASSFIPKPAGGGSGSMPTSYNPNVAPNQYANMGYAKGGMVKPTPVGSSRGYHDHSICMAHGGMCMAEGGPVPGEAPFPGDTEGNDVVEAHLSPGEAVLSRSTVATHPDLVNSLLTEQGNNAEVVDSNDVVTLLKAMKAIRMGA